MSKSRRTAVGRLLGVSAAVVTLSTAGIASAAAHGGHGGRGWDQAGQQRYRPGHGLMTETRSQGCEFSFDGTTWYPAVKVDDLGLKPGDDGRIHLDVRLADGSTSCSVSLAAYRTQGATWQSSGKQVFHDWDTVDLDKGGKGTDTLDVAVPDATCFAQVDLYYGNKKYDGKLNADDGYEHGALPAGPDHAVIGDKKIAWWNGGTKDCSAQTVPSTPPSTPPSSPAAPTTPASSTPPTHPETTPSGPAATTTPPPSPSDSQTASAPPPVSTTPEVSVSPSHPTGDLAETGSDNVALLSIVSATLLAAGGGVFLVARRRSTTTRH
jgi:LPXTG-motif cell wall-anchored protein